jgi:2,5-diketo-D-gluconate reductase A
MIAPLAFAGGMIAQGCGGPGRERPARSCRAGLPAGRTRSPAVAENGRMSESDAVPVVELPGDARMPMVGFGTWKVTGAAVEGAVAAALAVGYRHIDTATIYGNEAEIGAALGASGLDRAEVFVTTKIRPADVGKEPEVLRRSLRALRTEYVDLWLVHWPARQWSKRLEIWNDMAQLRDEGLVKAIGVSNFTLAQIDRLIEETGERPAVNQIQWGPSAYDPDVVVGHKARGIALEGYSGLKDSKLKDPVLAQIAAAHQVTVPQVVLRWHLEHGITIIPKSVHPDRIAANFDVLGFALSSAEVARIDALGHL